MQRARNTRAPQCTTSNKGIILDAAIGVMPFRSLS
jgi:hypothetical protein